MNPEQQIKAAIWVIENQTPDEVERLRKLLCLVTGYLRASQQCPIGELIKDAISRELGVDDLKIQRFRREFERKAND